MPRLFFHSRIRASALLTIAVRIFMVSFRWCTIIANDDHEFDRWKKV